MGAAVAVMVARERHIVEAFERRGATTVDRACTPEEAGAETSRAWQRLRERSVVRETSPGSGQFYVDVEVWTSLRRARRRIGLTFLFLAVAVGVVVGILPLLR
jgi:hypothetical protein